MTDVHSQRRLGIVLIIAAAIAWSTAPFFTRLLAHDSWTILFWRGVFASSLITVFLAATEGRAGLRNLVAMGRSGWLVASLSTLAMVAFIPALQMTSVANVAVIVATQPFIAAGLAYVWFREAARWRTLLASLLAFVGVVITVSQSMAGADLRGIALACLMVFSFSLMTVAVRRYQQKSMVAAAAMSNLLGSLVSLPFAQGIASVSAHDIGIFAMFGGLQVAMGLTLFVLGSRLLPSGEASLIATLETPLMVFWVWVAFAEVPAPRAMVGGALVIGAVVADILGDNRERARARQRATAPS
ncbi:MAG: DMT family transporter [Bradyrhizobium sp.]|nr:DMT family transporter [Bradyrhizobium sp.]